jgi:hypothetical protein
MDPKELSRKKGAGAASLLGLGGLLVVVGLIALIWSQMQDGSLAGAVAWVALTVGVLLLAVGFVGRKRG